MHLIGRVASARVDVRVGIVLSLTALACATPSPPPPPTVAGDAPGVRTQASSDEVQLDSAFARLALEQFGAPDPRTLDALAATPGAAHLLGHAVAFDQDVPRASTLALVTFLAGRQGRLANHEVCAASLAYFDGAMREDPSWILDPVRYLPEGTRLRGSLFLVFGYDIGVAHGGNASLNCGHERFRDRPRELVYYAIHELHHVGFMSFQPPVPLSRVRSRSDLAAFIRYCTQLEGMAVLAAYDRRRAEGALLADPDYAVLEDASASREAEDRYWGLLRELESRPSGQAGPADWEILSRLASERLWYRAGARMAACIERARGRAFLVGLVQEGPERFFRAAVEAGCGARATR